MDTLTDLVVGEAVHVETIGGQRLKGDVEDVTPVEFTIAEDGRSIAVPSADVRTVRKQDSLLNGVFLGIGAAVGAAVGFVYVKVGSGCWSGGSHCRRAYVRYGGSFGLVGAGVGAAVGMR